MEKAPDYNAGFSLGKVCRKEKAGASKRIEMANRIGFSQLQLRKAKTKNLKINVPFLTVSKTGSYIYCKQPFYRDTPIMQEIIQLKVSLTHSKPLIWRQILVTNATSFFELHHIIQITMGWENYHMFEFDLEGYRIGEVDEEEKRDGYGSDQLMDSKDVTLKDVITQPKDTINYLYDFGDGWRHQIKVENFLSADTAPKYPTCIDGEMNCPPEDCGGIGSFYHCIGVLKDKKHPDYKEIAQWFNRKYDIEQFDKERVNRKLKGLDKYIKKWITGE